MPLSSAREVFEVHMPKRFEESPGLSQKVNATYKFVLTGDGGGVWIVDLTRAPGSVREEDAPAQCTLTVDSRVFLDIVSGRLSGQKAFSSGALKVAGSFALALKLSTLLGR